MIKQKQKHTLTTDSTHTQLVAKNVLDRQFNQDKPNQACGSDITYIWTQQGWFYLAVVITILS